MNLLLDTHTLLWALSEPEKLPSRVKEAIASSGNAVYVSAVNTWELAVKAALGRVELPFADLERAIEDAGFAELAMTIAHSLRIRDLPRHHRDPFDRLLVAQAVHEALTLVTRDPAIRSYPVRTLWE